MAQGMIVSYCPSTDKGGFVIVGKWILKDRFIMWCLRWKISPAEVW